MACIPPWVTPQAHDLQLSKHSPISCAGEHRCARRWRAMVARRRQVQLQETSKAASEDASSAAGGLAALLPVLVLNASPAVGARACRSCLNNLHAGSPIRTSCQWCSVQAQEAFAAVPLPAHLVLATCSAFADTKHCHLRLQVRALACRLLAALVQRSEHLRFRLLQHLAALLPQACQSGASRPVSALCQSAACLST